MLANSPDFWGSLPQISPQKGWGLCKFHPKIGVPGPFGGIPGWAGLKSPGFGNKKVGKYA